MGGSAVLLEVMGLFDDEVDAPKDPLEERQWQRMRLKRREWLRLKRVAVVESAKGKYRSRAAVMEKMLLAQLEEYEHANPVALTISFEQLMKDEAEDEALELAISEAEARRDAAKKKPAPAPVPKGRKKS